MKPQKIFVPVKISDETNPDIDKIMSGVMDMTFTQGEVSCKLEFQDERYVFTKRELLDFIQKESKAFLEEERGKHCFIKGETLHFNVYGDDIYGKYIESHRDRTIQILVDSDSSGINKTGEVATINIDYLII